MVKRLCAECGERPAKFPRRSLGGRMRSDRNHDLCAQCASAAIDRAHAQKMKRPGGPLRPNALRALLVRTRAYLDPSPTFWTSADEDAWWTKRREEKDALIQELDTVLDTEGGIDAGLD